jgi:hypothetical protein
MRAPVQRWVFGITALLFVAIAATSLANDRNLLAATQFGLGLLSAVRVLRPVAPSRR